MKYLFVGGRWCWEKSQRLFFLYDYYYYRLVSYSEFLVYLCKKEEGLC